MVTKTFYLELPPDASATLRLAGRELSRYVCAVFGWRELPGRADGAYRLRLGTRRTSFAFRSFLNQVMRPLGDDGYRIVADATTTSFCAETDKGVLNAAYAFLAGVLRVKWVEPGAIGEVLPRREVRAWWPLDLVEAPSFAVRGIHAGAPAEGWSDEDARLRLEWMARNRLNHLVVCAGDGYERLRKRVVEECRLRGVTLEVEVMLPAPSCASRGAAVEEFVRSCVAWVREHPEAEVVNLSPGAGGARCECAGCRAMRPAEQWSKFLYPALATLRTEFPERQFASRVGPGRYETLVPDAECRLGVATAFDTSLRCPWHELGADDCRVPANARILDALRAWKAIATAPVYVFESIAAPGRASWPVVNPETLNRDMTTYRSLALDGVVVLDDARSFASDLVNLTLFARLAWDVEANWRGIWPDVCVKYFGGYSLCVMDFIERLREKGEGTFTEAEWQGLDALMGPAFEGEGDLFTQRYARVRDGFLRMRECARTDAADSGPHHP